MPNSSLRTKSTFQRRNERSATSRSDSWKPGPVRDVFSVPDTFLSGHAPLGTNRSDPGRAHNHLRGVVRTLAVEFRPGSGRLRAAIASAQIEPGLALSLPHLPSEFSTSCLSVSFEFVLEDSFL